MNLAVVLEGSATAPESVRDFQISDRFQDFGIPRACADKVTPIYERGIFRDFREIPERISGFRAKFLDFTDFRARQIHERFRDFARDFSGSVRDFSKWRTPRYKHPFSSQEKWRANRAIKASPVQLRPFLGFCKDNGR